MKRLALLLCAIALGVTLSAGTASAHWRYGWHHGWWGYHTGGGPVRVGPRCWVNTDDSRGLGYYKWCDDRRWRYRHWRRWHRWHPWW